MKSKKCVALNAAKFHFSLHVTSSRQQQNCSSALGDGQEENTVPITLFENRAVDKRQKSKSALILIISPQPHAHTFSHTPSLNQ